MKWPGEILQDFAIPKTHTIGIFHLYSISMANFLSISLGHVMKHKPLFSEVWFSDHPLLQPYLLRLVNTKANLVFYIAQSLHQGYV